MIATLRDEIALLPAAADVRYVPPVLEIEDRDGNVSGLLLQVLTPPTADEVRDASCGDRSGVARSARGGRGADDQRW